MIFAGVDVGAATAKAVILRDNRIAGHAVIPTGHDVRQAAEQAVLQAMERAGISGPIGKLDYVISTGYARNAVAFADKSTTEIICHARGAHFIFPEVRTIIDIGGQDSKAIEVDDEGSVRDFVMNDKCAAGTGRFLEVMAGVLQAGSVDNMGPLSLKSTEPCQISSTCTIFAESEVVSLRAEGRSREDLIAGVHESIASRVANMSRRIKIRPVVVFTGGVAKNEGVKKSLDAKLGVSIAVPGEPQIIGALGAALFAAAAAEQVQGERKSA